MSNVVNKILRGSRALDLKKQEIGNFLRIMKGLICEERAPEWRNLPPELDFKTFSRNRRKYYWKIKPAANGVLFYLYQVALTGENARCIYSSYEPDRLSLSRNTISEVHSTLEELAAGLIQRFDLTSPVRPFLEA